MGAAQHTLFCGRPNMETPGFCVRGAARCRIDFFKPARMDDVLDVVTWPVRVKGASINAGRRRCGRGEVSAGEGARCASPSCSEGGRSRSQALRTMLKADQA